MVIENLSLTANGAGELAPFEDEGRKERPNVSKLGVRAGVYYKMSEDGKMFENIVLKDLNIYDIYLENKGFIRNSSDTNSENGKGGYGFGILFVSSNSANSQLSNILIENCCVENVSHTGIRFAGSYQTKNMRNIEIRETKVLRVGGPGIQQSGVIGGHLHKSIVDNSGNDDDARKWKRGSGYWCFGSDNIVVEHCRFLNANGPSDSYGAHIDYNCNNVVYEYNLSENNAGGFIEVLGNNYNCIYRYNVSINDGWRDKNGQTGVHYPMKSHQWGHTILISNYSQTKLGPWNTYIYNNTIYVDSDNVSRNAIVNTAEGIFIANNIFYIEGESEAVKMNAQYQSAPKNGTVIFKNNLFLDKSSWGEGSVILDSSPKYGDLKFKRKGGSELADYIPTNVELIKNRGIIITPLPSTIKELQINLNVTKDIFGNPITGLPDMGAIEIQ